MSDDGGAPFDAEDAEWLELALEAVGRVIDFWGFKRNHGRVWAYLYLRGEPVPSGELRDALDLSKGAVSMITTKLREWNVVRRRRIRSGRGWLFRARTDFLEMVQRVIRNRELDLVEGISDDLDEAADLAARAGRGDGVVDRLTRMKSLADMVERAIELFLKTAELDATGAANKLDDGD